MEIEKERIGMKELKKWEGKRKVELIEKEKMKKNEREERNLEGERIIKDKVIIKLVKNIMEEKREGDIDYGELKRNKREGGRKKKRSIV